MGNKSYWLNHDFNVYNPGTAWNAVAGIYIFCGLSSANGWVALYIGQANSFKDRLSNHERWDEAVKLGATHIHAKLVANNANRDRVEAELIEACQPQLNTMLR